MPTYEYECEKCGHEFEQFHSIKDDPIKTCPVCNNDSVRRLLGIGAGIIFKGSGFYETDYKRKDSESSKNGKEDAKSDKTESKADSKSDKKKEKKSDSKNKSSKSRQTA